MVLLLKHFQITFQPWTEFSSLLKSHLFISGLCCSCLPDFCGADNSTHNSLSLIFLGNENRDFVHHELGSNILNLPVKMDSGKTLHKTLSFCRVLFKLWLQLLSYFCFVFFLVYLIVFSICGCNFLKICANWIIVPMYSFLVLNKDLGNHRSTWTTKFPFLFMFCFIFSSL